MKISELQEYLKDRLNGVETLVKGRCKVFAEDTHEVYDEANQWTSGGKVAVVVVTPEFVRSGDGVEEGLPFEGDVVIRCIEKPAISRHEKLTMPALDAAEVVMHELDGKIFGWKSTRQTVDRTTGTITATATFGYSGTLTR